MTARYEIEPTSDGRTYFTLKAPNGEVILKSQAYQSEQSAFDGIESCRVHGTDDANFVRETSQDGRHYFNLEAANHQVIGTSQMYSSRDAMEQGIASVRENAMRAHTDIASKTSSE